MGPKTLLKKASRCRSGLAGVKDMIQASVICNHEAQLLKSLDFVKSPESKLGEVTAITNRFREDEVTCLLCERSRKAREMKMFAVHVLSFLSGCFSSKFSWIFFTIDE